MILWLRYVIGLLIVVLIVLDNWIACAIAGIIGGGFVTMVWMGANVLQTIEYWQGTCPRWMTKLFGHPNKQKTQKFSVRHNYILIKTMSIIFGLGGTAGFLVASIGGHYHIILAVLFPMTWIFGVAFSEVYFKHKYNKIKDWSEAHIV